MFESSDKMIIVPGCNHSGGNMFLFWQLTTRRNFKIELQLAHIHSCCSSGSLKVFRVLVKWAGKADGGEASWARATNNPPGCDWAKYGTLGAWSWPKFDPVAVN